MLETYNLYNLEAPFQEYLDAGNQKPISIKNYLSDVRHFFGWLILYFKSHKIQIESDATITQFITAKVISEYRSYLSENNIPHKTINRRLSTIRKFCSFCISQGWMKENPAKQITNISIKTVFEQRQSLIKATESPELHKLSSPWRRGSSRLITFFKGIFSLDSRLRGNDKQYGDDKQTPPPKLPLQYYMGFVIILIFVAVMGAGIYNQFFVTNNQSLAYPTALTKAGRILSFQGRLTDTLSNPITTATNVQFRLWKVATLGTEGTCTSLGGEDCLYKTGTCSVTPDQDGIFSTLIGSDCGSEIAASVFTENPNVYLGITVGGDAEMTPRQQIANVGYAINSETLQGLPPGTGTSVIPYINVDGNLLMSASSPGVRSTSTSTDFTLSSAKATIIQSAGTGDVILQATESGTLIFRTGGDTGTNTRMTVTNSGNVGIGTINPAATALLDLTSTTQGFLAPRMTTIERDAIVSPATGLMIYNTSTNQYNVFNGTSWGAVGGGGAGAWSDLTDPTTNLALTMGAYTSTFTYNAATGANNLFNLTDTLNNTGTGYLLNVTTASGSTLKPFHVSAAGNEALTVLANGSVGVGNAAPGTALDVTGTGRFSSGLTLTTGALNLTGTSGALTLSGLSASSIDTGANNITFTSGNFNTTATGINGTAIGATTPSTGAFTTLTSSGSTTLGTGASSVNAIGSSITPGSLTLHGATTLDNTFTVSGSNLTSLGGNLTVTGTSWTATPTISGLITATSGLTANGNITSNANTTLGDAIGDLVTINSGAWTFANDTNFALTGGLNGLSFDTNTLSIDALNDRVGIGTTAPTAKLDVVGDLNVSTYATVGASLAVGYPAAPAGPGNAIFSGNVGIGTAAPAATAILDLTSTTKGFLAPRMTTTERDAISTPATGLMIYNTSTNQYNAYNGTVWGSVGGGGGAWSGLTDPSANLTLNMAAYTSTFTYNAATGANNLFNLTDTLNNTGTGYLLNVTTASGSSLKPFHVSAAGNEALTILANGNVGVGNTSPSSLFSVGAGDLFQIDTSGNTSLDNQADIRFYEANVNGTNYTGFQAPASLAGDVIYSLPIADGTNGFLLQTNGSGALSWFDIASSTNAGPWTVDNGGLYPDNSTLDLFIGGTASSSAKFAFINVDSGTPAASISGNLALAAPSGADPAGTLSIFNGGSLNFQTSVGGDAGLLSRLFITNSGNLGIGTTSPTQKLTLQQDNVADMLGIKDGANNTSLLLADGGVTTFKPTAFDVAQTCSGASCVSADTGSFTDNTTEAKTNAGTPYIMLPVAAAGSGSFYMGLDHKFATINIDIVTANIGMSTMLAEYWNGAAWASVSPTDNTTRLTVDGTITFTAPTDWATNSVNGTTKYYIRLRNSVGSISTAPTAYFTTPTTGSRFYVYGQSGDANAALYIADSGNVGLGTNDPQARLDIGGATSTITNTSGDITIDAASNFISFAGDTLTNFAQATGGTGTASAPTYSFTSSTNTGLYLATTNVLRFSTNGSDRVTIDALGNVGIGTTSPAYKLDVSGAVGANYFVDNDNVNYGLDPDGTTNFGGYSLKTSGGALLAYDTGKVGIGNQTPVGKLDVSGFVTGKALVIFNETGNQALLTASASGVTKFTVNHDGSITLAGQTSAPTSLNGGPLVSGTMYYNNTTITGGLSGVTAPGNTGTNTGDLFLYGEDSAWHRIALDMTQYSSSAANIENTSYIEIAHNQNTNDLSLTGWFKDTISGLWKTVSGWASTIINNLGNQFNPVYTQKQKVTTVSLKQQENSYGTGSDGAITVSSNTSINATSLISGRTCVDGGDAVNYSVTGLTSTTATLETAPSAGCLAVGDEMLLINLRGTYSAMNNTGNWETVYVQSIASNIVTFTAAKTKYYGDGTSDDSNIGVGTGAQAVMLQRVPNYTTVTVNTSINFYPDAWVSPTGVVNNGAGEGGVMFFRATGAVAINGTIHANAKGYIGGAQTGTGDHGGAGGEAYCGIGGTVDAGGPGVAGAGGGGNHRGYTNTTGFGYCGGGGAGGSALGSVSRGGAGGGGQGYRGSAGGGGYGTFGYGGGADSYPGANGGTNSSGNGGYYTDPGGGGGGGGTYGDVNLTQLMFGSSGGAGGSEGSSTGGAGGTGGGIVYIAANSVTVSGSLTSNASSGGNRTGTYGGGGGGGAGGSVKIVGNTINLGASLVTASGGGGGSGQTNSGGAGGVGRVAVNYGTTISGSTSPTYTSGTFISSPSTTTTVEEGDITRNVNFYEDEDETDVTKITKLNLGIDNNMYANANITQADLTNFDFITAWIYAGAAGNTVKLGFGENTATEHETLFNIKSASTWQKVYWDISHIPAQERDAVRIVRVSGSTNLYIDNITAARFFNTPTGSTVTSTPNNYFQYRVILASSNPSYNPTLYNIQLDWNNGFKIEQTDLNKARLYNFTGATQELRLDAIVFGADLAEYYTVDDQSIGPGDAVAMTGNLDQYGVPILRKASSINDPQLAGIISTKAGQSLGIPGDDRRLLALAGRVPVKVDPTSLSIAAGDLLTSSGLPGYARKAKFGDKTIGKALTPWTVSNGEVQVLALVNNSISLPNITDVSDAVVTKVETVTNAVSYQVVTKSGEIIENAAIYSRVVVGTIQSGLIKTIDLVAENITVTQKITSPIADIGTLNVSEKIRSPIVETNEIKPVDQDLIINLDKTSEVFPPPTADSSTSEVNTASKGALAKIIIKGLQGKTVTTIDSEGNASFAGQIIADSLTINNDATVSGNFASNTLTVNDASVSGTLIAGQVDAKNINDLTKTVFDQRQSLTDQSTSINDIQKLLADIRNQPLPDANYYQNLDSSVIPAPDRSRGQALAGIQSQEMDSLLRGNDTLENLTVTGQSNLYNVSVSNSLLVGTTLVDQNSIISLASELKLSALSTINLFDGAVMIARDGKITTRGEIIAQGGIRTNEIRPLTENDQVAINNLITNNIAIADKYLEATTAASIIAAADNFDLNGIYAPAIETATASAGIAILPEDLNEIIIYNNYVKKDSLIYLTPTSLTYPVTLTIGKKEECTTVEDILPICKKYFTVVTNTPTSLPVKFNWLIIN